MRTITITRGRRFYCCLVNFSVLIDDREFAVLRNGDTKIFEIPDGSLRLQTVNVRSALDSNWKSDVYHIKESDGDMIFSLTLRAGLGARLILERKQ